MASFDGTHGTKMPGRCDVGSLRRATRAIVDAVPCRQGERRFTLAGQSFLLAWDAGTHVASMPDDQPRRIEPNLHDTRAEFTV